MTGETGERIGFAHGRFFLQRGVISKAITKAITKAIRSKEPYLTLVRLQTSLQLNRSRIPEI